MKRRALFFGALLAGAAVGAPQKKKKLTRPLVTIETSKGVVKMELFPEEAPNTVANFIELIRKGFYNSLAFHRIEDWVVQGGDPRGDGTGGPGYTIRNEPNKNLRHARGALGMANSGRDTAGSQFYIVKKDAPKLDNGQYTLFGKVVAGMDVVDRLLKGDVIKAMTVEVPATGPTRRAEPDNLAYPILPDDVNRREFSRTVRVRASVPESGGAAKITLVKGSGDKEIDAAIVEALSAWVWAPALKRGEPHASDQEFVYDLASHSRRYDGG